MESLFLLDLKAVALRGINFLGSAFFCGLLWGCLQGLAVGGNVLTDEDDILRIDASAGLANPSPGIIARTSVLWTKYPAEAFGVAAGYSQHELVVENANLSQVYVSMIWEHSTPIWDGYYALRSRGGLGMARSHRTMDRDAALKASQKMSRIDLGLHLAAGIGLDVPLADLIWGRLALEVQRSFTPGSHTLSALVGGVAWGGQWFGIGD